MTNTLTSAELKRRGAAAIEEGLRRGPIHILKRNRRTAVVLSEDDYRKLLATRDKSLPGMSAAEWLRSHTPRGHRSKQAMDERLRQERDW